MQVIRKSQFLVAAALLAGSMTAWAKVPAGLDSRSIIAPYLDGNLPSSSGSAMPALLSATGAFISVPQLTPHPGLIPYDLNSPLWTDNAQKLRWIGLPYDGTNASPKINFSETGSWVFPAGTIFVKQFDLVVDERVGAANPVRRLETRILIRNADGSVRGASYHWRLDNSEADIVNTATNEVVNIIQPDGSTRSQTWLFPEPADCVRCHNANAGAVLGPKTAQLNKDYLYHQPDQSPDRTDNQLHTWFHLGMFDGGIVDSPSGTYPAYAKMAAVDDSSATLENRVRSYMDANCAHCHVPGGEGVKFDARYSTPVLSQNIIAPGVNFNGLIRNNAEGSLLYLRDSSTVLPMPPIARNVVDTRILTAYSQWASYVFTALSATEITTTQIRLQFDRAVDVVTATTASNYTVKDNLNNVVAVNSVVMDADPSAVLLNTGLVSGDRSFTITINRVAEQQSPGNPVWPNTKVVFNSWVTDTDNDGQPDTVDLDDDGDAVPDYIDAEPLNAGNASELILPVNSTYKGSKLQDKTQKQ